MASTITAATTPIAKKASPDSPVSRRHADRKAPWWPDRTPKKPEIAPPRPKPGASVSPP
jgi:hypothetical protein